MADNETDYASYGQFAWMYNADPKVKELIDQASTEKWPAAKLAAAIQGTPWWQSMVQSERQWQNTIAADPRTALDTRNKKAEEIQKQAEQMGITLRPGVADSFADSFFRYGWTDIQLENSLLSQFTYEKGKTTGAAATTEQQLTQLAGEYGVTLSDAAMQGWIVSIEQGRNSADTFKAYAAQQAANLNPWAKSALDTGLTLRQITEPIFNKVASELEINPNTMNLNDSKWASLMQVSRDPKSGEFVMPSWADVERTIRTDAKYGWDKTQGARQLGADGAARLLSTFGAIAADD